MSQRMQILALRFSSLGDVVLSTVLLDAVQEVHAEARITWVTKAIYADFFREDPRVDELILLEEGTSLLALLRRLESQPFDLVLDAHGSLRSRFLCAALPPTRLRRLGKDTFERLLLLGLRVRRPALERTHVERCLDLVPEASRHHRPRLRGVSSRAPDWLPREETILAVAPGARHAPKQWPLERLARVVRHFQRERGVTVALFGSERERARELQELSGVPLVDLSGGRPLGEVAAALGHCRALLCNDSGLLHVAEAMGTPVVAIYGPTSREWGYLPLDPRSHALGVELPCRPCSRNGARPCRLDTQLCMTLVREDDVLTALEETWTSDAIAAPR